MILVAKIVLCVAVVVMAGCAGNRDAAIKAVGSTRQNVFKDTADMTAATGKALLAIEFPVKNIKARIATTYFKHNDPPYTVTVNIDGQAIVLKDEPVLEDLPWDFRDNPEAGTGWKYTFKKELLLEPGIHHLTIAVPLSDVVLEKVITLHEGTNLLQVAPEYRASGTRDRNYPKFNLGLNTLKLLLNGQEL